MLTEQVSPHSMGGMTMPLGPTASAPWPIGMPSTGTAQKYAGAAHSPSAPKLPLATPAAMLAMLGMEIALSHVSAVLIRCHASYWTLPSSDTESSSLSSCTSCTSLAFRCASKAFRCAKAIAPSSCCCWERWRSNDRGGSDTCRLGNKLNIAASASVASSMNSMSFASTSMKVFFTLKGMSSASARALLSSTTAMTRRVRWAMRGKGRRGSGKARRTDAPACLLPCLAAAFCQISGGGRGCKRSPKLQKA
mmetsp:Transcript_28027/g.84498  ORF Transcript_28027/g.84498 Transcript_28027/m.84498 type:complete len:250 (+) Transcript_28027:860-1609(+)